MTALRDCFTSRHVLLPVIHVEDYGQASRNVDIALQSGANGVFLINHMIEAGELSEIIRKLRDMFADQWFGVNFLGQYNEAATHLAAKLPIEALWRDNAGIKEEGTQYWAERMSELTRKANLVYFGGIAFKYQPIIKDVAKAAAIATQYVDVVTTSGDATGLAADLGKVKAMKAAIGDFPLGLASGITPDNLSDYREFVDCFLVATGVSKSFSELDPVKLKALADQLELS